MNKYLIITIIILLAIIGAEWKQVEYANKKWETSEANVKAYSEELSTANKKNTALQFTVSQLENFSDSVLQALDNTRKELNIKGKDLKALQAIMSGFTKKDTVTITQTDTLFKNEDLSIDTLIGDEWYNVHIGLRYPSKVIIKPYFKSEKHIVVFTKKETINPPKKCFILRWFQKKRKVLHIDVVEKNPYVENETSKYVEILK